MSEIACFRKFHRETLGIGVSFGSVRGGSMKRRIAMWAGVGFLVAAFWAIYLYPTALPIISNQPILWMLARLSQPVVFASFFLHHDLRFYWVIAANAATYAMVGVLVETFRQMTRNRVQVARELSN